MISKICGTPARETKKVKKNKEAFPVKTTHSLQRSYQFYYSSMLYGLTKKSSHENGLVH